MTSSYTTSTSFTSWYSVDEFPLPLCVLIPPMERQGTAGKKLASLEAPPARSAVNPSGSHVSTGGGWSGAQEGKARLPWGGVTVRVENSAPGAGNPEFQGLPVTGLLCDLTKCVTLAFGPRFSHRLCEGGQRVRKGAADVRFSAGAREGIAAFLGCAGGGRTRRQRRGQNVLGRLRGAVGSADQRNLLQRWDGAHLCSPRRGDC